MEVKKILLIFLILIINLICVKNIYALEGDTTWQENWTFKTNATAKTITLTKYNGSEETYKIPAKAIIDGVEYSVVLTTGGSNAVKGTSIKSVSVEEGVKLSTGYEMFSECTNIEELDLTGLDTSNISTLYKAFNGMSNLRKITLSGLDFSRVTSVREMFNTTSNIEEIDFSNTDMSSITTFAYYTPDGRYVFAPYMGMTKLKKINMKNFNTASLTTAERMFMIQVGSYNNQNHIEEIDVTNWNTSNVTSFYETFAYCGVNNDITITGLDTLDTSKSTNFSGMFLTTKNINDLTGVENWDMSSATNLHSMFSGSRSITKLDLSSWNTSNVTDIGSMFISCESLSDLNVSTWDTSKVKAMDTIFKGCASLEVLNLKNWTSESVENKAGSHMWEMLGAQRPNSEYPLTPIREITLNEKFEFKIWQSPYLRSGYWRLKEGTEEEMSKKYTPGRLYNAYNNGITPPEGYEYDHTYILTELDPAEAEYYARGWLADNVWEVHYPEDKFKGYCINLHRASPNGYYDRTSVNNNAIINEGFLDSDNYGWEPLGSNMEEALITLIYYGWGNDADGIQAKYELTDEEFLRVTQDAIWNFTDRYNNMKQIDPETNRGKAYDELTSKRFSNIPNNENLKLYLYESLSGHQNLLSISGLNDQAYAGVRVLKLAPGEGDALVGIEGAEFTIYDSNNNEVCKIISDENGYATKYNVDSIYGIPEGVYTIRETKAPRGYYRTNTYYTFIVRKEDDNQIIIEGKLSGTGQEGAMIFENQENTSITGGGIKIEKLDEEGNTVSGAKFAIFEGENEIRKLTTNEEGMAQTAKKELELNKEYTIKEIEAPDGYIKTDEIKTFTLTENEKYYEEIFVFRNSFKYGKVTIEAKKILNNRALKENEFEFELIDNMGNVVTTAKNDIDGNIKFELEYTGKDLGYKTYTIREIKGSNVEIEYDEHEEEIIVYISDTGEEQLECVVEYDEDGAVFINTDNYKEPVGHLRITKRVEGKYDESIEFEFTVELDDKTINGTYGEVEFINGVAKFTLKDGGKKLIQNLPVGINYMVTQKIVDGYTTTYEREKGAIIANTTITSPFVSVTEQTEEEKEEETTEETTDDEGTKEEDTNEDNANQELKPEKEPEPEPKPEENKTISPKTGDSILNTVIISIVSGFGIFFSNKAYKKQTKGRRYRSKY